MNDEVGVMTRHPEYTQRSPQWKIMRDVMEGDDAIKAAGEKYLPKPSTAHHKFDTYEEMQYNSFKNRSIFTNYTAQIHDCLHGMIESRPAKIDIPQNMKGKDFIDNVDYQGNSADQFFSDCLDDVLTTGFGGVLIDLPNVDPNMSVREAEKKVRPNQRKRAFEPTTHSLFHLLAPRLLLRRHGRIGRENQGVRLPFGASAGLHSNPHDLGHGNLLFRL